LYENVPLAVVIEGIIDFESNTGTSGSTNGTNERITTGSDEAEYIILSDG
jgi:hypothetical protein